MNIVSGWRLPRLLLWLLGSSWLAVATPAIALAPVITETGPNYGTYPITAIPAVGPAGAKVVDPAFGTTVLRLTDGTDGSAGCFNQYSYWPVFNKNSTRIAVLCAIDGQTRMELFDLDAATFTASNRRLWPQVGFYEDYIWSAIDPNVFFFRTFGTDRMLHSYNDATGVTTLVRDFTAELDGGYPVQWSRSMDDDVFAFTHHNSLSQPIGYKAWKRSTNTFLLQQIESGVDEVQIDKSGRYLVAKTGGNVKVWDLQTGGMTQLATDSGPWDGFNNSDVGTGTVIALAGPPSLGISYRQLSTPKVFPTILPLTSWNQRNNHYSMLADDEGWALVTNEGPDTPLASPAVTEPFQYELYQVATDGSGRVRRLVHHNSSVINYNRNAFGNISRDGKFLAWTSDWGNSNGRTDVYIAQIPPASLVTEFYNAGLDHYFITADANEAAGIDSGSAGPGWVRTGKTFKSGGSASVCRFYGSPSPGPNSHFYTAGAGECAALKQLQATVPTTEKRWNYERLEFRTTAPTNDACPAGTMPAYRAYNNGWARGIDSNHRITTDLAATKELANRGWINEGAVMCPPL